MSEQEENAEYVESNLQFQWQTVNPVWGRASVPKNLRDKLSLKNDTGVYVDSEGNEYPSSKVGMWDLLGFYTRDLRLGFLSKGQSFEAQEWLEIANDCIRQDLPESFFLALGRVVAMVEISQSTNGNLRRSTRTQRKEENITYEEPKRFGKRVERY